MNGFQRFFLKSLLAFSLFALSGCDKDIPYSDKPLRTIYADGVQHLKNKSYERAADEFDQVEQQHPYSFWAPKAQLLSAYASFKNGNYARAIGTLDNFIQLHPYHELASYAYYLRALSYFDQIQSVSRDMQNTEQAFQALGEVAMRFPDTPYGKVALYKRNYAFQQLAAHHMHVGRYYQSRNQFLAALSRFQLVYRHYRNTDYAPEAVLRIIECSLSLGLVDEAQEALKVLKNTCSKTPWYQHGSTLLKKHEVKRSSLPSRHFLKREARSSSKPQPQKGR